MGKSIRRALPAWDVKLNGCTTRRGGRCRRLEYMTRLRSRKIARLRVGCGTSGCGHCFECSRRPLVPALLGPGARGVVFAVHDPRDAGPGELRARPGRTRDESVRRAPAGLLRGQHARVLPLRSGPLFRVAPARSRAAKSLGPDCGVHGGAGARLTYPPRGCVRAASSPKRDRRARIQKRGRRCAVLRCELRARDELPGGNRAPGSRSDPSS